MRYECRLTRDTWLSTTLMVLTLFTRVAACHASNAIRTTNIKADIAYPTDGRRIRFLFVNMLPFRDMKTILMQSAKQQGRDALTFLKTTHPMTATQIKPPTPHSVKRRTWYHSIAD
jgi:hypothetical protein